MLALFSAVNEVAIANDGEASVAGAQLTQILENVFRFLLTNIDNDVRIE